MSYADYARYKAMSDEELEDEEYRLQAYRLYIISEDKFSEMLRLQLHLASAERTVRSQLKNHKRDKETKAYYKKWFPAMYNVKPEETQHSDQ